MKVVWVEMYAFAKVKDVEQRLAGQTRLNAALTKPDFVSDYPIYTVKN